MDLSPRQLETLRLACDALLPSLEPPEGVPERLDDETWRAYWRRRASDLGVADEIPAVIGGLTAAEQKDFRQLLDLLGSPLLGLTWWGKPRSLSGLSPADRERLFQRWSQSPLPVLRKGFQALKKLAGFLYFAKPEAAALVGRTPLATANPNWPALGYPGPLDEPTSGEAPLPIWTPDDGAGAAGEPRELTCDVVVVGSGAGGGLAAGMLAEAGQEVILVDKGPYLPEEEMSGLEADMVSRLYEAQGALATVDGGTTVFAGSCLGGGTTVNWAGSFETPGYIRREWAAEADLPHLLSPTFEEGVRELQASLSVTKAESPDNPQNAALRRAAERFGHDVRTIPRNVSGCMEDACVGCGYCGFGCRKGKKKSTLKTWIRRASEAGARILVDTEVSRLVLEAGEARGVEALHRSAEGRVTPITIRARRVVVAAGALHTPALLLRSGLEHPHLGRNLYLHPVVAVSGIYPEALGPMSPWHGAMMSCLDNEFAQLDGNFGFRLETPPVHTGLIALATPWVSARQYRETLLRCRQMGNFIVLVRDRFGGRVTVDRDGRPRFHYGVHPYDLEHLLQGLAEGVRLHLEAGAEEVFSCHSAFPRFTAEEGADRVERRLAGVRSWGWTPNRFQLFTAHQMGTCRMGGDGARAPVAPDGRLRGVRGVHVVDASTFPSASGVNPMITIQSLAYHSLKGLLAEL